MDALVSILESYGLATVLLLALCWAAWWILRQLFSRHGWLRPLAARAVEAWQSFLGGLQEVQARQVDLEEQHFRATGRLAGQVRNIDGQHQALATAGLHACDVAEDVCRSLNVPDAREKLDAVRQCLRAAAGPPEVRAP